jgi:putative addiction module CopG family antidote
MSTLSVPLPPELEKFINSQVKSGNAANKADVVRRALVRFSEDEAVRIVLEASQEVKDGKVLRGDLRELAKKI